MERSRKSICDEISFNTPTQNKKRKLPLSHTSSTGSNSVASRISYNDDWESIDRSIMTSIPQRYESVGGHFPINVSFGNACKWCYHYNDRTERRVVTKCWLCDVNLCMTKERNCFYRWHHHNRSLCLSSRDPLAREIGSPRDDSSYG